MKLPDDAPPLGDEPLLEERVAGFAASVSKLATTAGGAVRIELTVHPAHVPQALRMAILPARTLWAAFYDLDMGEEDDDFFDNLLSDD